MDDFDRGLTELASKLRIGTVRKNAGCAAFVLRARDEIASLRTVVDAQRDIIDYYEAESDRSCFASEDVPDELREAEDALRVSEKARTP